MISKEALFLEIEFDALRSRGPGGQNVNKVSSAAQAFWNFQESLLLNVEQKWLIQTKLSSYINKEGLFTLRSDEYRDLPRNKERCVEKILDLLVKAFHKNKARKASKPTYSSKLKKLESKSRRADIKRKRSKSWKDFD